MSSLFQPLLRLCRPRPYLSANVLLIVILAAANWFLWQRRESAIEQHGLMHQKGEAMLHALTNHARITSDLAAVSEALQLIDHNLTTDADLEVNLGYFYQMETLSRVRLRQLNQLAALPPAEGNPFKTIPFSLKATGSYAQLISFLRNLETGPRLINVTGYSFSRGDAETGTMVLDLTIQTLGRP
ncbi:MAG TPA: type 4a pilus biogenesis protein PilO [Lacunisphaera sp.]|nr:type 4a pilus biogenesis protein PilO [Lacunisphaera sp.]